MFPIFAGNSASTGYNLTRSLRLRKDASAYLNRTLTTPTNQAIWTWSAWVKRGVLTPGFLFSAGTAGTTDANIYLETDNTLVINKRSSYNLTTTQVLRDPSAWYHIVVAYDSPQATSTNRLKLYINGSQVTAFGTATYPTLNETSTLNSATATFIGRRADGNYFDGYLTEVNFIDGQALTPSSFGSTNALTGVWQPARYAGTYGTNGFYLPFTDNSALTTSSNVGLGKDFSGNGNYWTTNNISITAGVTYDSMTDVPTLTSATAANFCVMNPLRKGADNTLSDANLKSTFTSFSLDELTTATIGVTSGKWYFEGVVDIGSSRGSNIGILATTVPVDTSSTAYQSALLYAYIMNSGNKFNNNTSTAYGAACTTGDIVGVAFDLDNGKIWFSKNGTWQASGDPAAGTNPAFSGITAATYTAAFYTWGNQTWVANFGQRPFTYTPPSGFVALNTFNIAAGTVTTSGSFIGNLSADGPFVYLNGVPTAMTINGNAVTFGTQADKLANGFKVRTASALYNLATSNTYSVTTNGAVTKYANAQGNP
jgi:hypothetical protein